LAANTTSPLFVLPLAGQLALPSHWKNPAHPLASGIALSVPNASHAVPCLNPLRHNLPVPAIRKAPHLRTIQRTFCIVSARLLLASQTSGAATRFAAAASFPRQSFPRPNPVIINV
jgi:hypothetical protein